MANVKTAIQYFENMIDLSLKISNWKQDQEKCKQGQKFAYAVDTNIIKFYANPWAQDKKEYTKVFFDDSDTINIGKAIANYIFFNLECDLDKLLLIPPHDDELLNLIGAIIKAMDSETKKFTITSTELSKGSQLKYLMEKNDISQYTKELWTASPTICKLFDGDPDLPIVEFSNIMKIFGDEGRVDTLNKFLEKDKLPENYYWRNYLGRIQKKMSKKNDKNVNKKCFSWKRELTKNIKDTRTRYNKFIDAEVLEWLEFANRFFRQEGVPYSIIFITGDKTILDICRQYYPYGSSEQSFADLYIREPLCFISEVIQHNTKKSGNRKNGDLLQWMNFLLTPFGELSSPEYFKKLMDFKNKSDNEKKSFFEDSIKSSPDLLKKISIKRKEYVYKTGVKSLLNTISPPGPNETVAKKIYEFIQSKQIQNEMMKEIIYSYQYLVHESLKAATRIIYRSKNALPPRTIPPLFFKNFQYANNFLNNMLTGAYPDNEKNILELLIEEDDTMYIYYLSFGILLAYKGRWEVTRLLADYALSIADKCIKEKHHLKIVGSEAAYLKAIALRHLAKKTEILAESKKAVDLARERRELFQDREELKADYDIKIIPLRFTAEDIARDLTYHHFRIFLQQEDSNVNLKLSECKEALCRLLVETDYLENDIYRNRLRILLLTNLISTNLLLLKDENTEVDVEKIRSYVYKFKEEENYSACLLSYRAKAYLYAAQYISGEVDNLKNFKKTIDEHFSYENISEAEIFPYDKQRYRFIGNYINGQ